MEEIKVEEPKLSRQQRRDMQRSNEVAQRTYLKLAELYLEFFMQNDPESDAVAEKQKEVSAKWRMYCKANHLIPAAFGTVDTYCEAVQKQYQDAKNKKDDDKIQEPTA